MAAHHAHHRCDHHVCPSPLFPNPIAICCILQQCWLCKIRSAHGGGVELEPTDQSETRQSAHVFSIRGSYYGPSAEGVSLLTLHFPGSYSTLFRGGQGGRGMRRAAACCAGSKARQGIGIRTDVSRRTACGMAYRRLPTRLPLLPRIKVQCHRARRHYTRTRMGASQARLADGVCVGEMHGCGG